ncbi:Homospermidine synthase-like protein [Enhygromyxa salina]|uniref:Homospermidine synthase-like protein n=1 Tax=Enhygromyxa salina TaxID=215803 RepID=A0A0C2A637_9BACT|nr:homospermidine synthase [Enhygromyxa salina]KIG18843.1 Homospermidine synthase-like protein [Enhygromyxa salina]
MPGTSELLLLDSDPARDPIPMPACARWLPAQRLEHKQDLASVLREHRPDEVIELAAVGTRDCMSACAEAGANYLTTAYDDWSAVARLNPDGARCMVRAQDLFDPPDIEAGVHLLCMGMNPGLINLLVARGLNELAALSGRPPSLNELDLHTLLFTEIDATTTSKALEPASERFPCTWSPGGCLEELLEPEAMITASGELEILSHAPHRALYEARCGDELIRGHLVPHEELVSLGAMYPSVDLAYCYRLPPASEASLAASPDRTAAQWQTRRLYPPDHLGDLTGFNRVGLLLCSHTLGELWIGWQTAVADALPYSTNATLLQVSAGVLAGWHELRRAAPGIYLPEDLDSQRTLGLAEQLLGPPQVIWDRTAPARSVAARRVSA